jgi:hypothetical protein
MGSRLAATSVLICGLLGLAADLFGQVSPGVGRPDGRGKPASQGAVVLPGPSTQPSGGQRPVESKGPAAPKATALAQPKEPAAPKAKTSAKEPATILVAPGPSGVIIACEDPAVLNEFQQVLAGLAGSSATGGPELTIFYLKYAKAAAVAETVERVLSGGMVSSSSASYGSSLGGGVPGGNSGAAASNTGSSILGSLLGLGENTTPTTPPAKTFKITPEPRLNALIVQASPAEVAAVEQLLTVLDQKDSPEEVEAKPKTRIIPVKNVQADEIATIIRQVYQDRMAMAAGQFGLPPGAQNLLAMYGGGMPGYGGFGVGLPGYGGFGGAAPGFGGQGEGLEGRGGNGRRGGREETQRLTVGVDQRTNSIVLSAPEPLFTEVQQLIAQLDHAAVTASDQTMRVVTLHKASPNVVQQALAAIMGNGVQFGSMGAGTPTPMFARRFGQPTGAMYRGSRGVAGPGGSYQSAGAYQAGMYQPGVSYAPNNGFPSAGYQAGGYLPNSGYSAGGYQSGGYQSGGYLPNSGYSAGVGYQPGGYAPGSGYPAGGYQPGSAFPSGLGYQPTGVPYYGAPGAASPALPGMTPGFQPPVIAPFAAPVPGEAPFLGP